ncbi:MAG: class I SAM-dependent methyltransferase, partial [Thermoflexus sp.]
EARRVLKSSGTFRFIEHVRAEASALAWLQDRLTPVWRRLEAGCHLNRQTLEAIEGAGFEVLKLQRRPCGLTPLLVGVARAALEEGG